MTFVPPKVPFITQNAVERAVNDCLYKYCLTPTSQNPVVDLEAVIEQCFQARLDQYSSLPAGVVGVTTFELAKPPFVQINATLTEAMENERKSFLAKAKWRSTLAHEAGHILLHKPFAETDGSQCCLFPELTTSESQAPIRFTCSENVLTTGKPNQMEFQANMAMRAILLPHSLFASLAKSLMPQYVDKNAYDAKSQFVPLLNEMSRLFIVSFQMASIRFNELEIAEHLHQTKFM